MSDPVQNPARRLAIRRLVIRNYRSLRDIRWPEDGLGWEGRIPDTVLVGGINGSGKTTLLETIFGLVSFLIDGGEPEELALQWLPRGAEQVAALLDIGAADYAFAVGSRDLTIPPSWSEAVFGVEMPAPDVTEDPTFWPSPKGIKFYLGQIWRMWRQAGGPSLLYFPTDRAVPIPFTRFKRPGSGEVQESPIYRYQAPAEWERSVEAVLYDARWRDLNAKEQGDPGAAKNFAAYEDALSEFFGGTKRFVWDREGVLHVETQHGDRHPLDSLSSGEKQVLLFVAELFRRWTPGSLVLVDEPELHLHESWLAALWGALRRLQRERGGQVIVTTQSSYLFGLGGAGSRVVLRGGSK
jgi:predicted ATPase